jgi:integrase
VDGSGVQNEGRRRARGPPLAARGRDHRVAREAGRPKARRVRLLTTSGKAPISGFSKAKVALDRIINENRAKADPGTEAIEPFVFHDLRRTMRTALSGLPVPDLIAELVIAHAKPDLHKVYDQHAYLDEKRRALDLWANKLRSIVEPQPQGREAANVVPLPVRG